MKKVAIILTVALLMPLCVTAKNIQIAGYIPNPRYDVEEESDTIIPPWVEVIFGILLFCSMWNENYSDRVDRMVEEYTKDRWSNIKLTRRKKILIILRCFRSSISEHPKVILGSLAYLVYLLIRCFV